MEKNICETKEYNGYTINIVYDWECFDSPRDWDNLGTIYSNHRNFNPDGHEIDEIIDECTGDLTDWFLKNHIWLKIHGYSHTGMTISTTDGYPYNDRFDGGVFGIIAVDKKKAANEFGYKICTKKVVQKAEDRLENEVKILDQYMNGECFGYEVVDKDGDVVESCWGFIGEQKIPFMIEDAKAWIDNEEKTVTFEACARFLGA